MAGNPQTPLGPAAAISLAIKQTDDALRDVIEIADYLATVGSLDTFDNSTFCA